MRYTIIISNTQARWNSLYNFYKSISINLLIPPKTMFIFSEEVTGVLQLCYIALLSLHARMWLQVKVVSYGMIYYEVKTILEIVLLVFKFGRAVKSSISSDVSISALDFIISATIFIFITICFYALNPRLSSSSLLPFPISLLSTVSPRNEFEFVDG